MSTNDSTTVRNIVKAEKAAAQSRMARFESEKSDAVKMAVPLGTTGSKTREMRIDTRHEIESALLKEYAAKNDIQVIQNRLSTFKAIELCPESASAIEDGKEYHFTVYSEQKPGYTSATIRKDDRFIRQTTVSKHCLAQFVPGLEDDVLAVVVSEQYTTGKDVDLEATISVIRRFCLTNGRYLIWTQSSIKGSGEAVTFYTVTNAMWEHLVAKFADGDGRTAANVLGLLFSDIDDRNIVSFAQQGILPKDSSHDGNVECEPALIGGFACQFRALALEFVDGEWQLVAIAKGTVTPVLGAGVPKFDGNTVKFMAHGPDHEYRFIMGTQEVVSALRQTKGYASWEAPIFLHHTDEIQADLCARVKKEVHGFLDLMKPENRALFSERMGGIEFTDFTLDHSRNVLVELLNANVEWCSLIEEAAHRFMIGYLTRHVIPSAGIRTKGTIFQAWEKAARAIGPESRVAAESLVFGSPIATPKDFLFYKKSPYKGNQGLMVHGEDLAAAKRDTDGDLGKEPVGDNHEDTLKLVKMFANNLNVDIVTDRPASKQKKAMGFSLRENVNLASDLMGQRWMVGSATTAEAEFIEAAEVARRAGDSVTYKKYCELAGKFAWMAQNAPVLSKYDIDVVQADGSRLGFIKWAQQLFTSTKNIRKSMSLQWHKMADEAETFSSPRDLAGREVNGQIVDSLIKEPKSLLDFVWNAGIEAVKEWAESTPQMPLATSDLEGLIVDKRGEVPGWAWVASKDIASKWAGYWAEGEILDENGDLVSLRTRETDRDMRNEIKEMIKASDLRVIDALLCSRAKNASTLARLVAQAGRLVEATGLHQQVEAHIIAKFPKMAKAMGLVAKK